MLVLLLFCSFSGVSTNSPPENFVHTIYFLSEDSVHYNVSTFTDYWFILMRRAFLAAVGAGRTTANQPPTRPSAAVAVGPTTATTAALTTRSFNPLVKTGNQKIFKFSSGVLLHLFWSHLVYFFSPVLFSHEPVGESTFFYACLQDHFHGWCLVIWDLQ